MNRSYTKKLGVCYILQKKKVMVNSEEIRFRRKDEQKQDFWAKRSPLYGEELPGEDDIYKMGFIHASDFGIGAGATQLTVRF